MVFLHIPNSLTEEEQMLQAKYAKLRKKKKQVAAFKNQGNAKPEIDQASKVSSLSNKTKKTLGGLDAKEQAKKMIRSVQSIYSRQKTEKIMTNPQGLKDLKALNVN